MDGEEDELLQMCTIREHHNPGLYELLLNSLLAGHYAIFKSLLIRDRKKSPSTIEIDHIYPHPLNKTLLDVACCNGIPEFVELLLEHGANPNKINTAHNRGPIHFVTESGHADALAVLLADPNTNPNLEAARETALHYAVNKNNHKCAKVLLDNNASPNIANSKGATPLHIAAMKSRREMVNLILNHSRIAPDLDNFWDFRKKTARDWMTEKLPDIFLPPKTERNVDFNILRFYLDANDEEHFIENLKNVENNHEGIDNDDDDRLLVMAAGRNFIQAVRELIQRKNYQQSNYNNNNCGFIEAAQLAVRRGYSEVLNEFLQTDAKIVNELIFPACQELGVPLRGSYGQASRLKCLTMILEHTNINVRCEDEKGNTPLHYAARAESAEAIQLLLQRGSYIGHKNILGTTPLADLSPQLLRDYFDECLCCSNDRTEDYQIEFNYTCLMPHTYNPNNEAVTSKNTQLNAEMEPLRFMAKHKSLRILLKHPLLASFLYLKWHRIKHLLYINFLFYVLFYVCLNVYILLQTYRTTTNDFTDDNNSTDGTRLVISSKAKNIDGLWSLTTILLILLLLREGLQLLSSPKHYVPSFENWIELTLGCLAAAVLAGAGPPIGTLAILLSAWELVILIGQHPKMSIGIEMFKTVTMNLMYFLLSYAFLIIAFALAFFTLFKDAENANFPDPGRSLFKTIIMLTGEFDANDIPFISHPLISHLIFILFIFLITIVLFNLLIGLAVSDTADILGKSELVGLVSRTKLISYAERIAIGTKNNRKTGQCNWGKMTSFTFGFLAKRILLFNCYLPFGTIAVRPYKANEIKIHGIDNAAESCDSLTMDGKIVMRAREILSEKGKITENQRIISKLDELQLNLINLQLIVDKIELTLNRKHD